MKTLLAFLCFTVILAKADPVTFKWEPDPEAQWYTIHVSTNPPVTITNQVVFVNPPAPNSPTQYLTVTLTNTTKIPVLSDKDTAVIEAPAGTYWASIRSVRGLVEGYDSNIVEFEVAQPPQNFRIVIMEATVDITGTKWEQFGIFRLKIPTPQP